MSIVQDFHPEQVVEYPNLSQIKAFEIQGLFGFKHIYIPFDNGIKILIGENGSGKTTILNIFYYSISHQFNRLKSINFASVAFEFTSGDRIEIKKSDLDDQITVHQKDYILGFLSALSTEEKYKRLENFLKGEDSARIIREELKKIYPKKI